MAPTEKHRETARKLAINLNSFASREDIDAIARALAKAECEGMKRAADELEAVLEKRKAEKKKAGNDYIASSIGFIRHLVSLSEAGEGGQ